MAQFENPRTTPASSVSQSTQLGDSLTALPTDRSSLQEQLGRRGGVMVAQAITQADVKQTLDDFRENTIGGPGGRLQLSFQMYTYNARALAGLEGGMDCIRAQNLAVDALQRKYGDAVKVYDVRRDLDRPVGGPVEHHILGYQLPGDTKIYGYDPIMNRHLGVVGEVRNGEPQPSGKTEYIVPGRAG